MPINLNAYLYMWGLSYSTNKVIDSRCKIINVMSFKSPMAGFFFTISFLKWIVYCIVYLLSSSYLTKIYFIL